MPKDPSTPGPDVPAGGLSRRSFVGLVGATAAGAVAASAGTAAAAEQPFTPAAHPGIGERPNILIIMADDLGWADLSSEGAPHISTPNLDRLAQQGVRFTDAYAGSSTCSPTRISLYTGRYPGRLYAGLREPIAGPDATDPEWGIPPEHPTMASLLRSAGYATAMFGKWHCGHLPWFSPLRSGWDEWLGNLSGGVDYFSKVNRGGRYDLYENEVPYQDLRYYTDILTERTVEYLHRDHEKPWLLNLDFTTPHWPWEGPGDEAVSDEIAGRPGLLRPLVQCRRVLLSSKRATGDGCSDVVEPVLPAVQDASGTPGVAGALWHRAGRPESGRKGQETCASGSSAVQGGPHHAVDTGRRPGMREWT